MFNFLSSALAHESYCSLFVCYHSSASLRRVWDQLNIPDRSLLNSKGLQQTDFAKKLSFQSYSSFSHNQIGHLQLTLVSPSRIQLVHVLNARVFLFIMKALKCKTLCAELAMHTHCTVQYISAFFVDDHLPNMHTQRLLR